MSDVEDEGVSTISLKVKTTTAAYDVQVKADATISDDHEKLETHNIGDGMALHLVVRQGQNRLDYTTLCHAFPMISSTATLLQIKLIDPSSITCQASGGSPMASSLFGGDISAGGPQAMAQQMMNNPEMMRQMMDNPIMQNIMGNPEIFRSLLANNPQIQQLIERNPELGHVLNDPDMMRQTMEMIRNPNMFQEMMRNHDLAIRNLQGIPGGEAALQRLYQDVQEPLLNSATTSRSQRAGQENSEALPNPWGSALLGSTGMNSLMEQMMSDPALMQSLMRPEMMDLFRQSISQNPSSRAAASGTTSSTTSEHENMVMSNPDVLAAMSNPRVLEALRMVQQGMDILRREAPALAGMFGSGFSNAPSANAQRNTSSANGEDPVNALNAMFAGMNTTQ
ncbi:hypothetical protein OSTOST_22063, partial [Ostertagia ostertagi]